MVAVKEPSVYGCLGAAKWQQHWWALVLKSQQSLLYLQPEAMWLGLAQLHRSQVLCSEYEVMLRWWRLPAISGWASMATWSRLR